MVRFSKRDSGKIVDTVRRSERLPRITARRPPPSRMRESEQAPLFKVTTDNGDDTYKIRRVFDDSTTVAASEVNGVVSADGDALVVGEVGLLVWRGDGTATLFRDAGQATGTISHIWQLTGTTVSAHTMTDAGTDVLDLRRNTELPGPSVTFVRDYLFRFANPIVLATEATIFTFPWYWIWGETFARGSEPAIIDVNWQLTAYGITEEIDPDDVTTPFDWTSLDRRVINGLGDEYGVYLRGTGLVTGTQLTVVGGGRPVSAQGVFGFAASSVFDPTIYGMVLTLLLGVTIGGTAWQARATLDRDGGSNRALAGFDFATWGRSW